MAHNFIVCDIAELSRPGNSLYKQAKKHKAKDFALVGDSYETVSKTPVSYCILITETVTEAAAKQLLTAYWSQAKGQMKVFAWIPINNIQEMVVLNLESNTQMRMTMLLEMLRITGAQKYLQNNTSSKDLEALTAQLAETA